MSDSLLADVAVATGADVAILLEDLNAGTAQILATCPPLPNVLGRAMPMVGAGWDPPEQAQITNDPLMLLRLLPPSLRVGLPALPTAACGVRLADGIRLLLVSTKPPAPGMDMSMTPGDAAPSRAALHMLAQSLRSRRTAESLGQVVNSLSQAVVVFDGHGATARVNAAGARLLNVTSGDLPASAAAAALLRLCQRTDNPDEITRQASGLLAAPDERVDHWPWVLPDGPIHLRVTTASLPATDGPPGRVWIFDDVTGELTAAAEATAARDELAQSEQRFRLLTEHAAAAVFSTDTSGKYTWIAQSVTDLLGWLPDQVLGRTPFDFVHPDDHGMVRAGIEANLRGEPVHLRARFRQIDGNYRWITVTARGVRDEQGSIVERIGSWHDAEAEVAAEQALREQADFLHAVLDAELEPHVYMRAIRNDAGDIVDFAYSDVNAAACDYLSLTHEQLNGARLLDILPGQAGSGMLALYAEAVRTGEPLVLDDYMYPHELLGAERRYDIRAVKVGDGLSFTWRDVTERYNAAHHLAEAKQRFELLAQNASDLVALATPVGVVQWFSESISLYGWSPEDVIGRTMHDFVHPADAHILSDVNEIIAAGHEAVRELRLRHKDDANRWHWFRVHLRPVMDDDGTIIGRVSGWRNIDIERAESELLEQERQRLAATLDSMLNPHIMVRAVRDAEGTVVDFEYRDANRAALAYLRVARDELLGSRIRERYGTGADMMMGWLVAVVDTGEPLERDDVPIVSAVTGGERWMDVKAVRVGDEVAFTWQDVTERHEATELLRHLAGHDALTGLPNRAHILDRLETLLSRPSVARDHTAVVFCDLDDMKTVNDTLGHAAGDLLLTETARRVTTIVADDGIVSRFGGDEILVVLTSISGMDQARAVAERLRAAIAEPIQVPESGSVVSSSASIGVTLAHPGDNVDGLIARADQAMYEAKSSGRNRVVSRP